MSIESIAIALHHSKAKGTAKLVLIGIANHDGDGGAWPAHSKLATYAGVDVRNVRRAIDKLVSLGEVRVHVQAGGLQDWDDHTRPNRYDFLVVCPPWCDRTKEHRDTRKRGTQHSLWTKGGAVAPPGAGAPPGGGGGSAPQTVPSEPATNQGGASVTGPRARELAPDRGPCGVCGRAEPWHGTQPAHLSHTYEAPARRAS